MHLGACFEIFSPYVWISKKNCTQLRSTKLKTRSIVSRIIKGGKKTLRNDAATSVIEWWSRTMITDTSETKLFEHSFRAHRSTNVNYLRILSVRKKRVTHRLDLYIIHVHISAIWNIRISCFKKINQASKNISKKKKKKFHTIDVTFNKRKINNFFILLIFVPVYIQILTYHDTKLTRNTRPSLCLATRRETAYCKTRIWTRYTKLPPAFGEKIYPFIIITHHVSSPVPIHR